MTRPSRPDMRQHWDRFGRENPMFYIETTREEWSREEFLSSGAETVDMVMEWLGEEGPRERALEIGCGLGRLSHHLARSFQRVDGVDVAPSMIEQGNQMGLRDNVQLHLISGADLEAFESGNYDLVFSYLVFQHVPDAEVLRRYLHEIARVLKPGGRAVLQYDTRPEGILLKLYKSLPDPLLPRAHRRFIRRYRRRAQWLREEIRTAKLEVLDERAPNTAEHFFMLASRPDSPGR